MSAEQIIIESIKHIRRDRVKDCSVPFALLHEQLVNSKEILPLSDLPREEKLKYWNETEGTNFQRIIQCQALRCYDLITQK